MSDDAIEQLVTEFFTAPKMPATTHEEWLLRLCSQLMDREARVVSVMEQQQQMQQQAANTSEWNPDCSPSSDASTKPCTETATTP